MTVSVTDLRSRWRALRERVRDRARLRRAVGNRKRSTAAFVGVTGSSGKSTTTALIAEILALVGPVRSQLKANALGSLIEAFQAPMTGARFVVAEAGVTGKDQMRDHAALLRPTVAIVTMIGIEHYSAFRGVEAVAQEKGYLVEALPTDGIALLNADDVHAMSMTARTSARVVTFGYGETADYRIDDARLDASGKLVATLSHGDWRLAISTRLAGLHFALPIAAAVACCRELGASNAAILAGCARFEGLFGRFSLFEPKAGPRFVIDTIKAPWGTLGLALDAFKALPAPKKWVVLGQLSDYAGSSETKHRRAYQAAREIADHVLFVGDNAHRSNASAEDRAAGRFAEFATTEQVFRRLREQAGPSDLVLLKSSGLLHLERAALAFDEDVRCWEPACGKRSSCVTCGLSAHPFGSHKALKRAQRRKTSGWPRLVGRLTRGLKPSGRTARS